MAVLHETDQWRERWRVDVAMLRQSRRVMVNHLDRGAQLAKPAICHMFGVEMTSASHQTGQGRDLLSAVALLSDLPERGLVRGQVGTIVEPLEEATALVEFSDDEGRAYAIVPCPREALLILRTAPLAA